MLSLVICCCLLIHTHGLPIPMRIPVGNNMTIQVRARDVNCDDPEQRNRRNVEICVVDPKACFNCIPKRSCGSMCVDQHVSCGHACPEKAATNQVEYHPVEVTHETVVEHHEEGIHNDGDSYGHDGDSYGHVDGDSVGHPIGDSYGPAGDSYGHGGDVVNHAVGASYGQHVGDSVEHSIGDSVGHPIGDYGQDGALYDQFGVHDGTHSPLALHHEDTSSEYEATHYGGHHSASDEHDAAVHGDNLLHSVDEAFGHHVAAPIETLQPHEQSSHLNSHEVLAQNMGVQIVPAVSHVVSTAPSTAASTAAFTAASTAPSTAPSNVVVAHNAGTVLASHGSMLTHDGVHAGIIMPPHGSVASSSSCPCNCAVSPGQYPGLPKVIGIENVQYSYNTGRHYCGGECTSVDHNTPATCTHECCP